MNNHVYRLVFNRVRGVLMAVSEAVKSHGKSTGETSAKKPIQPEKNAETVSAVTFKPLAFCLLLALGQVFALSNAQADIIADQSAPKSQQAVVLNASNGVPVVNIQTPSAAGVSRNTYSQFEVNNNGAILNNSRNNVSTQLGGYIQGNPYLATGTARVILNEVNSANPSYLNGYVEVAGSRAQVVIANPAGISCKGCGFINANQVTLTTGSAIIGNSNGLAGSLDGYLVRGGVINFLGAGLDTSTANYTDVIARAVNVNANLFAQNLQVITGTNQVNVASNGGLAGLSVTTPNAGSPIPSFAIDVAALGGMYAGKITMIGTEAGLGVRNAGTIGASAGELSLSNDGQLLNTGRISANTNAIIATTASLQNQGTITAQNNLSLNSQTDVQNSGLISASHELKTQVSTALNNDQGTMRAQRVELHAASVTNTHGNIEQTGAQKLTIKAQTVNNTNNAVIGNLPQTASTGNGTGSGGTGTGSTGNGSTGSSGSGGSNPPSTATGGSVNVVAVAPVVLADGLIDIQGQLDNNAGQFIANGTVDLTVGLAVASALNQAGLVNTGTIHLNNLSVTGNILNNSAGHISVQQANINAMSVDNTSGKLMTQDSLSVVASQVNNTQGSLESGNSLTINTSGNAGNTINNNTGLIRANGALSISSSDVNNTNTFGANQGIQANAVILLADQVNNSQGQILANTDLSLTGHANVNNSQGLISAIGAVSFIDSNLSNKAQSITNTAGRINAGSTLTINSNSLTGDGEVSAITDLSANLNQSYTHNSNATLSANGNLSLSTQGNLVNLGKLSAGQTLTVNAANVVNQVNGEISAQNTHINATNTLTNRGLIDGGDTFINAATLTNIGTGTILGDHIAIAANTINNVQEISGSTTSAAIIAARQKLDIGATSINNREHSLLFSAGDVAIGGALDANHHATVGIGQTQAATLNNNSATIEALGNLDLNVTQINNKNDHFSTHVVQLSSTPITEYQGVGSGTRYSSGINIAEDCNEAALCLHTPDGGVYQDYYIFQYARSISETQVASSDPASIIAAGYVNINAGTLLNDNSKILAGGALNANVGTPTNTEVAGQHITTDTGTATYAFEVDHSFQDNNTHYNISGYAPAPSVVATTLSPTVYQAHASGLGLGATIASLATHQNNGAATGASSVQTAAATTLTLPITGLFTANPTSTRGYLIETNPRFANYRNWLSSDYILKALNYDPATTQQRLGDGFYEQKLVREQIGELTGRRFLAGYASDQDEYQALMNNAVSFARTYTGAQKLSAGVALSAEQVAALTSDIVWLVAKDVKLADGSIKSVLAPQVYVRPQADDLKPSNGMMTGNTVNLTLAGGTLTNTGTIAGRTVLNINADNINNLGGNLQAKQVTLTAKQDINNNGSIRAADSLSLQAGHDINIASTTETANSQSGNNRFSRTYVNRVAGLYVTNPNGVLVASAGNDINLTAAVVQNTGNASDTAVNTGSTSFNAGHDLNLNTINTAQSNKLDFDAKNHLYQDSSQAVGTQLTGAGNVTLNAGHDLNAKAANVTSSAGALNVTAGQDINLTTAQNSFNQDESHYKKENGFLSSTKTSTHDELHDTNNVGSSLSGSTISLNAGTAAQGGNINITGSNVVSDNGTSLNAANDINISSATDIHSEQHLKSVKKSGLMSSGGLGVTVGSKKLSTSTTIDSTSSAASTVGSINGNVDINACLGGKTGSYTQTGSDVLATNANHSANHNATGGNIDISAQNVTIQAATDSSTRVTPCSLNKRGLPCLSAAR